jgi:hypothetical protein
MWREGRGGGTLFFLDGTVDDEGCSLGFLLGDLFSFHGGSKFRRKLNTWPQQSPKTQHDRNKNREKKIKREERGVTVLGIHHQGRYW